MTAYQKDILQTIYGRLTPGERFQLALILLGDFDPEEDVEISEEIQAEYQKRKQAFLDGKLRARPWREVMGEIKDQLN